jgi:hypothetical protein
MLSATRSASRITFRAAVLPLIILIAASVFNMNQAQAFKIGASIAKLDTSTDGSTLGTGENAMTILNLKAGTLVTGEIYVGGIYDSRTDDSSGSKTERTGYGATIGYHSNGWFLDGSFLLSSQIKTSGGTMIEGGSGYAIDLGRNFDVMSSVYLGLQISYKSISYTKVNGAEQSNKIKSELTPMLNVGVEF